MFFLDFYPTLNIVQLMFPSIFLNGSIVDIKSIEGLCKLGIIVYYIGKLLGKMTPILFRANLREKNLLNAFYI